MTIWKIYRTQNNVVRQKTARVSYAEKWISVLLLLLVAAILLTVSYTHGRLFLKELGLSLTLILLLFGHRVLKNV